MFHWRACASNSIATLSILAAQMKDIDRAVLEGGDADMAKEPPRDRLFDVLMRRLEALAPVQGRRALAEAVGNVQSRAGARAERA